MSYSIYLDESNNIDNSGNIQDIAVVALAQEIQRQRYVIVAHVLQTLMNQGQRAEETVNANAASVSNAASPASSGAVSFVWPGDDTQPNPPFDSSIPPKNPGETDGQYYLRVLKKLESMISWQKNHPMNINGEITLLTFMVNFVSRFPQGLSLANEGLMLTLMQNLIASVYVDSKGNIDYTTQAMQQIRNLFAGKPVFDQLLRDFTNRGGFDINTYMKAYSRNKDGKTIIDWETFLLRAGGDLSAVCVNYLPAVMKNIYTIELEEIYKLYLACKNPFLYYLLLLSVIGQKEADTQNNVAGCGDMLKLLAKGESATSDAMSSLAVLVNLLKNRTNDLDLCNDFIAKLKGLSPDDLKKLDPELQAKIANIIKAGDLKTYDPQTIQEDLNIIKDIISPTHMAELQETTTFKHYDFAGLSNKIHDYETEYHGDAAQKLAQSLLMLQEMSKDLETLLPGIKDSVKKLFGDNGDGDFFSLTKLDADTLQKAADGDATSQKKISDAIFHILPQDKESSSSGVNTLNSDINRIGSFYNDQNSLEQAQAQNISSNDQKMLSFIQEMYKQPVDFIKAIMQFMQKS